MLTYPLLRVKKSPNIFKFFRKKNTASAGGCSGPVGKRLCGKNAIVTASTDGIGFAIAKRLAQEGAKVIISSRKENNVQTALQKLQSEGLDVYGRVCHVSNAEQRRDLFEEAEKLGGLDILVSNAAVNPSTTAVLDCDEQAWDKIFDVNVKASFLLAKEALPLLRLSKRGRIIFTASVTAYLPLDVIGAYCVSKCAVIGLTRAAAGQLAKENITVNSVAPGIIQTRFSSFLTEKEEDKKQIISLIPLKRLGVPEEIAGTVAFLASADADYITGETIVIAGGVPSRL